MLKNLMLGTAAVALSVTAMAGSANALLIDAFTDASQAIRIVGPEADPLGSDPAVVLTDNAGGLAATEAGPHASIIGGYRDITTTLLAAPNAFSGTTALAAISDGVFSHSQDSFVRSNSYVTWDGLAGGGLGSADLTDGGNSNVFHLIVLQADDGVDWSLTVTDSDSFYTHNFENVGTILSATDLYLSFNFWTANGIDMTDIFSVRFGANTTSTVDFDTSVALIRTTSIPEPASLTLLGAGLMGLSYFGKRRKA